jgi:phosphopantetheinyl transferase
VFFSSHHLPFDNIFIGGWWGLCELDRESRYEKLLTEDERVEYARFKSHKRRREWLGARVALKRMIVESSFVESPLQCQVIKDRFGCPRLRLMPAGSSMSMNCSISHKDGAASVCVSYCPEMKLGIDMETLTERAWRVREAFINQNDSLTAVGKEKENSSILWACKEAASKVKGMGMLIDFRTLTVRGEMRQRFTVYENGEETMGGSYLFFGNFVVALCHSRVGTQDMYAKRDVGFGN